MFSYLTRFGSIIRVFIDVNLVKYNTDDTRQQQNEIFRIYPKSYSLYDYLGPFFKPSFIIDNIYIGSAFNAASSSIISEFNIKYIINVTNNINNYFENQNVKYTNIPIRDNNQDLIDNYLENAYQSIINYQSQHLNDNILIHCFFGASRSVCVVIYYLMRKHKMCLDDALIFMKQRRYLIHPTTTLLNSVIKTYKLYA